MQNKICFFSVHELDGSWYSSPVRFDSVAIQCTIRSLKFWVTLKNKIEKKQQVPKKMVPTIFLALKGPISSCRLRTSSVVMNEPTIKINEKNVRTESHLKLMLWGFFGAVLIGKSPKTCEILTAEMLERLEVLWLTLRRTYPAWWQTKSFARNFRP